MSHVNWLSQRTIWQTAEDKASKKEEEAKATMTRLAKEREERHEFINNLEIKYKADLKNNYATKLQRP